MRRSRRARSSPTHRAVRACSTERRGHRHRSRGRARRASGRRSRAPTTIRTFVLEADRVDRRGVRAARAGRCWSCRGRSPRGRSADWIDPPRLRGRRARRTRRGADRAPIARRRRSSGRPSRSPPSWSARPAGCSTTTVAYAKERVQFDRPIGSLPGDPAQARRHGARRRARRGAPCTTRRWRSTPTTPTGTAPSRRQGRGGRGRHAVRPRTASRSTAASATRGSTTCTCTSAGRTRRSTCSARRRWHHDRLADLLLDVTRVSGTDGARHGRGEALLR